MPKEWYLRPHVGYEHCVKTALQRRVRECGREAMCGEKQTVERRLFPGYIFIEMTFSKDIWRTVRAILKIVGFVGEAETAPTPMPIEEVQEALKQTKTGMATPRPRQLVVIGVRMKIVEGPWQDFTGTVESVKPKRSRLRVAVSVFGRPTPVELDCLQVRAA